MSSRSAHTETLARLSQTLNEVAAGSVRIVGVLASLNEDYQALHGQVSELSEALDGLERRLTIVERG